MVGIGVFDGYFPLLIEFRARFSEAYINIYQRITVLADPGQALGSTEKDSGYAGKEDVKMEGQ